MQRIIVVCLAGMVFLLSPCAVRAEFINHFGVDIAATGGTGTPFYDGEGDSTASNFNTVDLFTANPRNVITFEFDTSAFTDINSITRFEIYLNASAIEAADRFTVELFNATDASVDPGTGAFTAIATDVHLFDTNGMPTNDATFGDHIPVNNNSPQGQFFLFAPGFLAGNAWHDDIKANQLRVRVTRTFGFANGNINDQNDFLRGANLEVESKAVVFDPSAVPEPSTLSLLISGLLGLAVLRPRRRNPQDGR